MEQWISLVSKHKDLIELAFTLSLILLTLAAVVVAYLALRKQAVALQFMEWATLKSIAMSLVQLKMTTSAELARSDDEEFKGSLVDQLRQISEVNEPIRVRVLELERTLGMR